MGNTAGLGEEGEAQSQALVVKNSKIQRNNHLYGEQTDCDSSKERGIIVQVGQECQGRKGSVCCTASPKFCVCSSKIVLDNLNCPRIILAAAGKAPSLSCSGAFLHQNKKIEV